MDRSTDGGVSWESLPNVVGHVSAPPLIYANTTFRDGIEDTFAVGTQLVNGHYPLYVSWEDYSAGVGNLMLSASADGGLTWSSPIRVNDNTSQVDAFQPNLTTAADGTVVLAFYDRRLACPAAGSADAVGAGLSIDNNHPFGAINYCINASVQLYDPKLAPLGNNIRLSRHTWDPELNSLKPASIVSAEGFIGDYYGNITSGTTDITTSVSTYNDGSNAGHFQQQVVATLSIP
jgi:hypothetical protein